jgi:hypothetical protein
VKAMARSWAEAMPTIHEPTINAIVEEGNKCQDMARFSDLCAPEREGNWRRIKRLHHKGHKETRSGGKAQILDDFDSILPV